MRCWLEYDLPIWTKNSIWQFIMFADMDEEQHLAIFKLVICNVMHLLKISHMMALGSRDCLLSAQNNAVMPS